VIAAEDQLESMGSVAEPAVRELATDKDTSVAKYAVDVLATIGTKESLPELEKASESNDPKLADAASSAIQRIQGRIN
jgi:HEAT repeat protein